MCPCRPAAAFLPVGMCIPVVPLLHWSCLWTTACFISLHTPLRNFVAIGFNIKEISFFLCSLSLLPCSRAAADWRVCSQKSTTTFVKSFYPLVYHELAHTSVSWLVHKCHSGRDIEAMVTATTAVQKSAMPPILCLCFLAHRWPNHHFLLLEYNSYRPQRPHTMDHWMCW